jgi:zinc-ribbon domain
MSKVLKWILYILLGLVVLAVIAGIVIVVFGGFRYGMMRPGFRMMEPFRYSFSPFRMIFGGLLGLGIFLLVIVGIVALVSALMRGNRPAQMTSPAPMTTPTQMVTPTRTCSNCGKPAQDDWKTCPYCGNPLT